MKTVKQFLIPIAALFLFMLAPRTAKAISFDTSSTSPNCGNVATCTWNHTIGSKVTDLYIGCAINEGFNNPSISSVTVGGTAAVSVASRANTTQFYTAYMYHLFTPAAGSQPIIVNLSGTVGTVGGFFCGAMSFKGSSISTFDAAAVSSQATASASYSQNITTATSGAWVIDVTYMRANNGTCANTPSGSQTEPVNACSAGVYGSILMSYQGPVAVPGSTTVGYTYSFATDWAIIVVALKQGPGGSTDF